MANHDRVSERYYGEINSEDSHEATRTRIHWMCREATGKRILDVGCSQGITSILLAREGFRVTGIDLEEESVRYAQAELAKESRPVRNNVVFRMLDITQWKVRTTFDTVLLGEVLEHFAHPATLLIQIHRLLQEDGTLVVTVPYGYHPFYDHKQTFYAGSLAITLMPYFEVLKLEVHHKYLCCVARKRRNTQLHMSPTLDQLMEWMELDHVHFAEVEQQHLRVMKQRKKALDSAVEQVKRLRRQENEEG
ncbi:methyltransferase domain-containing protein [Paenibacillus polymyxa]|uniref:class I SAM-dependent methyltransferase n=1 Tax=Paenibacillus polymyxa TaxID=1406 RepID=UPI001BE6712E|nr:methyltransferase domain-containing protein [Paenibacillus polymyxa]MBT2284475.1 methyltransferase domain-containing protein [Paenibacillus polymyxa]